MLNSIWKRFGFELVLNKWVYKNGSSHCALCPEVLTRRLLAALVKGVYFMLG